MVPLGHRVQCRDFLGCQAYRDDLHRLGTAPGTATAATLQLRNVVASFGLIRPLLDLLFTHHTNIV